MTACSPVRHMRAILLYLTIVLVSIVVAFGGFVAIKTYDDLRPRRDAQVMSANAEQGNVFMMRDPELGWRPVPNVHFVKSDSSGARTEVITDRRGFRIASLNEPTSDMIDVLAIGCSQTWGQGIWSARDTYAGRLGALTGAVVANAGASSYGTAGSLLMLKRHLDLKPRVVIYGLFPEHFRRNFAVCGGGSTNCDPFPAYVVEPDGTIVFRQLDERYTRTALESKFMQVFQRALRFLGVSRVFSEEMTFTAAAVSRRVAGTIRHHAADAKVDDITQAEPFVLSGQRTVTPRDQKAYERILSVLDFAMLDMSSITASIGAQLVVVWIPNFYGAVDYVMPAEISRIMGKHGIPVVDLTEYYRELDGAGRINDAVIPNDGHISAQTHAWIAGRLAEIVLPMLKKQ